jgi:methylmalonyl-CoA mutase C-terminal domain/subunit
MHARNIRILLAKLGLGHDNILLNLAKGLGEAGFEVIYTELEAPEAIVSAAIQESVDLIGITTLPGVKLSDIQKIIKRLEEEESENIIVTAGGVMDEEDIPQLLNIGIQAFFPKGTTYDELITWVKAHTEGELSRSRR